MSYSKNTMQLVSAKWWIAGHGSRAVQGIYCLRTLGSRDRVFESNTKHGCLVCVCVYSVFVFSCVWVAALRCADHSSKEFYTLWNDHESKKLEARAQGGCRASEKIKMLINIKLILLHNCKHFPVVPNFASAIFCISSILQKICWQVKRCVIPHSMRVCQCK
jgi:hypothetical protein